jgi:hypothetical protein
MTNSIKIISQMMALDSLLGMLEGFFYNLLKRQKSVLLMAQTIKK